MHVDVVILYGVCGVMCFFSSRLLVRCGAPPLSIFFPSGLRFHSCFGLLAGSLLLLSRVRTAELFNLACGLKREKT
jgi:hypothetical protein